MVDIKCNLEESSFFLFENRVKAPPNIFQQNRYHQKFGNELNHLKVENKLI